MQPASGVFETPPSRAVFTDQQRSEFMLAAIRTARIRVTMLGLELDEIGVALKHNMVTSEFAVAWIDHIGATPFMRAICDKIQAG